MKICFDGRAVVWYGGSGMGSYSRALLNGFATASSPVQASVLLPDGYSDVDAALRATARPRRDFWEQLAEHPATAAKGCDLLHDPNNGFALPAASAVPCVVTIHDLIPLILPKLCGEPYAGDFRRRIGSIAQRAEHIIAVSEHTKHDIVLRLGVPPEKITVIHEAADPRFVRPDPDSIARCCHRYGLTTGYLLYVGGFSPRKRVDRLIRAFCAAEAPFGTLAIAGREGPRSEKLRQLAASLCHGERVRFLGHVDDDDLPALYGGAGLFAYPSLYEGFGLPPLEAAACGCPVLTSYAASLPEILGDGARYIPPDDEAALAQALAELAQDEDGRRELAARGRRRAQAFSPDRCFRQTIQVYESLCR